MKVILFLVLVCLIGWLLFKFLSLFKIPKTGALSLVSGGVKAGKSTFAVYLAYKNIKHRQRSVKVRNWFRKFFKRGEMEDIPQLYSNIPLSVPYIPLTDDLLLRKKRFIYGSVVYVCEASLVADSMCIKDLEVNDRLLLFNKLIGHELKGGLLIYDTQCINDLHYSVRRCLSEYFYIHHTVKWIPFFLLAYVKENRFSEDGSVLTTENEDTEVGLKRVIIPKSTWKKFDCYCYSALTDDLPVVDNVVNKDREEEDLKARNILTFKKDFPYREKKVKEIKELKEVTLNEKKDG